MSTAGDDRLVSFGPDITNEIFLRIIFGDQWQRALIAGFPGNPETHANWQAYRASMLPSAARQRELNMYFCPSLVRGTRRWISEFMSFHVIVVDDYGTKVPVGQAELVLGTRPSYVIETSPGNYQAGWLMEPVLDLGWVKGMLKELRIRIGAGDNLADPVIWRRMPVGINGKVKYQGRDGRPWRTELASGDQP